MHLETAEIQEEQLLAIFDQWRADWNLFAEEVLGVSLDADQKAIIKSVQVNPMTAVASGTARGKDFVAAVAALCFLYLTTDWNSSDLTASTKVICTAPTDRQIGNIMVPEFTRLFNQAKRLGFDLPGRLTGYDIRTDYKEWFLTGFRADEHNHEAWSGLHAPNIMFVLTEATGISQSICDAIEGNLQGNSRILLVFNPNVNVGYAADAMRSKRFHKFRLSSLNAPNVLAKKVIIPGQVDYAWVKDKVESWATPIGEGEFTESDGDFAWEGAFYRPNDLFRTKVLGLGPKEAEGQLIPLEWIEAAQQNWKDRKAEVNSIRKPAPLRLGVDIAGMGRDSSCFCPRYGDVVEPLQTIHSSGKANHMEVTGHVFSILRKNYDAFHGLIPQAFIDTIGEGAGVFSRLEEMRESGETWLHVYSCKFSEKAESHGSTMKDETGQYEFANMRAYLFWAVRDWLNPRNKHEPCLPPDEDLKEELTATQWKFQSSGKIIIEPKEEIKKRLKRSPDKADSLANTFYPISEEDPRPDALERVANLFH